MATTKSDNKKYKILFLETHHASKGKIRTHGIDFARIINPYNALKKHPEFECTLGQGEPPGMEWEEAAKYYDLIFSSYIDAPAGYVHLAFHFMKERKPHVTDVDDNLWEIPMESPTYQQYQPGSTLLHFVSKALEKTPFVTTTNMILKRKLVSYLGKNHDQVKVIPNFIDLNLYDISKGKKTKSNDEIVIGFFGTNTHVVDMFRPEYFSRAMKRILKEHPNVIFETTGFFLPQLKTWFKKQYRFRNGTPDIYSWIDMWKDIMANTDIVVAPLDPTDFNKCKSGIKYLEYSAAKKPGVYQDLRQYQELVKDYPKRTGFLAQSEEQWYKALKQLVESEELRKEIGQNAYDYVKEKHTTDANVQLYADYFKEVIERYRTSGALMEEGFILPERGIIT